MAKVNKCTRADEYGKKISCPHCKTKCIVYHFSWAAITCDGCGKLVDKNKWNVVD
jgi:ribosomal protein S27E